MKIQNVNDGVKCIQNFVLSLQLSVNLKFFQNKRITGWTQEGMQRQEGQPAYGKEALG